MSADKSLGNFPTFALKDIEGDEGLGVFKSYLMWKPVGPQRGFPALKAAAAIQVDMGLTECDDWVQVEMADSDSDSDSNSDDDSFNLSPSDSSSGSDDDSSDSEKEETAEEKAKREEFEEKKRKYDEKTERNKAKEQSNVVLDVKPEDDTTNLDDLIQKIRDTVVCDGLHWGAAEKKPLAYGIFKIRIISTIVNIKVSVDWMQEEIEKLEGVQSTDIVSFMKI